MKESKETLQKFGFTADEIEQIVSYVRVDSGEVFTYEVERAMFDDRREYVD